MSNLILTRRAVMAGLGALAAAPGIAAAAPGPRDSFLVLGDWGRRGGRLQRPVADQLAAWGRRLDSRFVVTVGDNFYRMGVSSPSDPHWRQSFADVYDLETLHTWYPALGNHDHNGDPDAQVAYSKRFSGWRMESRYYRQTLDLTAGRTLDLFVLDTAPLADPHRYPARKSTVRAQWEWFDREMLASRADWKIVVGHHPIVSSGYQNRTYPRLNRWLQPRLELHGVHAYLTGHDHHLEQIEAGGVTHVVSGGGAGGDPMSRYRAAGHVQGWPTAGFAAVTIAGDVMSVAFVDAQGHELGVGRIPRVRTPAAV